MIRRNKDSRRSRSIPSACLLETVINDLEEAALPRTLRTLDLRNEWPLTERSLPRPIKMGRMTTETMMMMTATKVKEGRNGGSASLLIEPSMAGL